jgi:hypothetical protein
MFATMKNNFCIYTAIMGDYDVLMEPKIITKGWDYVCITNNKKLKVNPNSVWKIFPIEDNKLNDAKLARKCKMLFWETSVLRFKRYAVNIWHDANIQINCDLNKFIEGRNDDFYIMQHPERLNVLAEVNFCAKKDKGTPEIMNKQMQDYIADGFPDDAGLCASGIMIRRDTPKVRKLMSKWFSEVKKYSKRDQISFNYVLWKHPISVNYIPFSILKNEFLKRPHKHIFDDKMAKIYAEIKNMITYFMEENNFSTVIVEGEFNKDKKSDIKISYE